MDFCEMLCFAKLFSSAMGDRKTTINPNEVDIAAETLKKLADNRNDWNQEQKELYKLLVDYAKKKTS